MMQGQADILSDPRSDEISYWTLISISQSRKAPFFPPPHFLDYLCRDGEISHCSHRLDVKAIAINYSASCVILLIAQFR